MKGGAWSVASRVSGALSGLVVLALAGHSLERVEVACLLLLVGIGALVPLLDLGIPNASLTPIASAESRRDHDRARTLVAASTAATSAAAILLLLAAIVVAAALDVRGLLGLGTSINRSTATAAWLAAASCWAFTLATSAAPKALIASGRASLVARVGVVGAVVQVGVALVAVHTGPTLAAFVTAASITQMSTGTTAILILAPWRQLADGWAPVAHELRLLSRRGAVFFGIGIAGAMGFEADGLVISHVLGAPAAAEFLVPARLVLFVPAVVQVFLTPLWPRVATAVALGDYSYLQTVWRRSLTLSATAAVLLGGAAAAALRPATELIAPDVHPPSLGLISSLFGLSVVLSMSAPVAAVLSGMDLNRPQLVSASAMAVANLASSIWLVNLIGTPGPALATVVCQTTITLVPLSVMIERRIRRAGVRGST